jgi:two-component system, OmpR family, response regulator ArlR
MNKQILIVEDEAGIARFLQLEFEHEGYRVGIAPDGRTALKMFEEGEWHLVILDIMLPDLSGLEILRRIRAESKVPVILLTARDAIHDRVSGLDAGADDYVTKPFAIEELLARVRAVERRADPSVCRDETLTVPPVVLHLAERTALCAEQELKLTTREFDLLAFLMKNRNRVLSRDMILNHVWGYSYTGDTHVVDVYIRYLRSKLENAGVKDYIETVRGVGYVVRGH